MNTDERKELAGAFRSLANAIERLAELPKEKQLEIIDQLIVENEEDNSLISAD